MIRRTNRKGQVIPATAAARPAALTNEAVVTETGFTLRSSWSHRRQVGTVLFPPAAPLACEFSGHERYAAGSHGQFESAGSDGSAARWMPTRRKPRRS